MAEDAETIVEDTPAPVAETPPALSLETTPGSETTDQRVRRWLAEHLGGGLIARDTRCWNELQGAIGALVRILEE